MGPEKKPSFKENAQQRSQDLDEFWDIGRLLPNQPQTPKYTPAAPRKIPEAVEIEVPAPAEKKAQPSAIKTVMMPPTGSAPLYFSQEEKPVPGETVPARSQIRDSELSPKSPEKDMLLLEYTPDSNLIHMVRIYEWRANYQYFDQFIRDAVAYADAEGKEARHEPFFSYFPQYAQLNRRQRAWYLYWRSQVRIGTYPETDYAYILLYLFELLNLPAEGEEAEHHRDTIAKVWMAYRKTYPQLDHYACEWLCDYCLIHRLGAPVLHLLPALSQIIATARLKEFYLSSMIAVGDEAVNVASAGILIAHSCQYDYRKSKFYSGEHKALFDRVIPRALAVVFPLLLARDESGKSGGSFMQDSTVSRDAYVGALCAYSNKRRIELSYTSFSRSHDLRFLVGDMVRHIENRIRGALLIRSRLTTHFLTVPLRTALDAWLDDHLPAPEIAMKKAEMHRPRPEYEALYDLPHTRVSVASADAIEQDSWMTTRILVEAFSDSDQELSSCAPIKEESTVPENHRTEEPPSQPEKNEAPLTELVPQEGHSLGEALGERIEFLRAVMSGDRVGQKAYCVSHKKLPDAVADEINDLSVECEIYDVILEEDGRGNYQIIEDYRETVAEILGM